MKFKSDWVYVGIKIRRDQRNELDAPDNVLNFSAFVRYQLDEYFKHNEKLKQSLQKSIPVYTNRY